MNKELEADTNLSHYRIERKIGAGGMGEVYLAEDTKLRRKIALKVLPESIAGDKERLRRFEQEAFAASALNHPNILTIHEFGADDDAHFLAAEFIEGETLRERLNGDELSLKEAVGIAEQIASALAAAHSAGIAHRDIKPENIMIRAEDGLVKVLDFGLAKLTEKRPQAVDAEGETRAQVNTAPGIVMGTVNYMSPEQARGKETDARTDIWSFGVALYEMLTGRLPFEGETPNDYIASILKSEPLPLDGEQIPDELKRIVRKTLRKEKDARYQTMKGLLADLKDLKDELAFAEKLERSDVPNRVNRVENQATLVTNAETTKDAGRVQTASSAEYVVSEIKKHKLGFVVGLAVLLLAAIGFGGWFYANRFANTKQIESIAVLPFVNETGNAETEYLSDGMTESLISSLSQIPKLNVKARSSVFRYKGKETDAQTIGRELNVQAILMGRIVQRNEQLILRLELVDARTENILWAEQYNRKQTDLINLQSEIARDVSQKLKTKLSGADEQKLAKNYTEDAEAYQLYLKGRFYWNKRTEEGARKGIEFFQQAVEKDPNYALAYVGISDSYLLLGIPDAMTGSLSPQESLPKARAAAERALEIDNSLSEAYASRAHVKWKERDWAGGEEDFKHSIELNPNYANAHLFYGLNLSNLGRHEEALKEIRRAQEIDPLSLPINASVGFALYFARRYDEAIDQGKKTLEMDATSALAHQRLGLPYVQKGMYREAIAEFQQAVNYSNRSPLAVASLGCAYAVSGNRVEAQKVLSELKDLSVRRYVSPYGIAMIYIGLGEKEQAFQWLEKAFEERNVELVWIKVEPRLDPLRDDPRFEKLLRKVGFPE